MKLRFAALAFASLALAGCSDAGFSFDDILNFDSPAPKTAAAAEAQPGSATVATAQAQAPSTFCRGVATQDAVQGAFDGPTQAKVAQKSYAQCMAQFSAN